MFLVRPQEGGKLLRWCLQSHPKVTQIASKSDPRMSKGICENVCFTAVKQYFCNFQGIPNPLKNESNVLLTLLLPKIDQIHENPSKLDPIRDIKIHQKPIQHGNGKRDMRKQAQQQCIPSYS